MTSNQIRFVWCQSSGPWVTGRVSAFCEENICTVVSYCNKKRKLGNTEPELDMVGNTASDWFISFLSWTARGRKGKNWCGCVEVKLKLLKTSPCLCAVVREAQNVVDDWRKQADVEGCPDPDLWKLSRLDLLAVREGLNLKKPVFFRALPGWGGRGIYPCPNFLALFQEVHFWSIKRVYFFKNANVLTFELFFRLLIYLPPLPTVTSKSWILTSEKKDQVARIGVSGGGRWFGQCPKENFFFLLMSSLKST